MTAVASGISPPALLSLGLDVITEPMTVARRTSRSNVFACLATHSCNVWVVSAWRPIIDGFEGNIGSEKGIVRLDEEHPRGARITIEEGGVTAPWSITCGVYGSMVHTAFFSSETAAREAALVMKERLVAIMDAVGSDEGYELMKRFVEDF